MSSESADALPVASAQALDGRALGARGARTRRRLLDATADALGERGLRDLRVVDVARAVGTSPATFYQYFRDLEEAVLVLADEAGQAMLHLADLLDGSWAGAVGLDRARALVEAFVQEWDEHRAVLRVRNLQAQEGDARFRAVRHAALAPFNEGFVAQVRAGRRAGRVAREISPEAAGAALVALLERMAAFHVDLEPMGVERTGLVETTARILHQTVGG